MKIIDFMKKGQTVRFYLGSDSLSDWTGDDWNDTPYEHNAGTVYDEYIAGVKDVTFDFDDLVLEPKDDWRNMGNSRYSKDDMKDRAVPCVIVVPASVCRDGWPDDNFGRWACDDRVKKYYFGDQL